MGILNKIFGWAEDTDTGKLCVDCKHNLSGMCDSPKATHSPVDGRPIYDCLMMRGFRNCGREGRWWEAGDNQLTLRQEYRKGKELQTKAKKGIYPCESCGSDDTTFVEIMKLPEDYEPLLDKPPSHLYICNVCHNNFVVPAWRRPFKVKI